jgi:quercetin dioxygenase-like cupin family protein
MKFKNIWKNVEEPLEYHEDKRGTIVDIFYKNNIEHVSYVTTKKGSIRGNHYHPNTTQYILFLNGSAKYWYKPKDGTNKAKFVKCSKGDIVMSPPNEIHAVEFLDDTDFIEFLKGKRGGKDYESDTIRVNSIVE